MSTRTWLIVSGSITLAWVLGLLLIPPFAQTVEQLMLLFLSTNAR
jgi:hypothetical protein